MRGDLVLYLDAQKTVRRLTYGILVPFLACAFGLGGFVLSSASGQTSTLPNGVASGDTRQTSTVLWARSTVLGNVTFEYSAFADFRVVDGYETAAVVDVNQPVKTEIGGLIPATQYYYRVTDAQNSTATGQFRTPSAMGTRAGLRFGASGDWQQPPPFPSLKNAPTHDLDFFIKLGDSIYADSETPSLPGIFQARVLEEFRIKHDENLSSRFGSHVMATLNASTSILATIDDHEIVDNFAGGAAPGHSPDAWDVHPWEPPLFTDAVDFVNETQAYKDAIQAFQEYHPIRSEFWNTPEDARTHGKPKFYRKAAYGSDAAVFLLDMRSFRDAPLPAIVDPFDSDEVAAFLASTFSTGRTIVGRAQMEALKNDLFEAQHNGIMWKFVVVPEPIQNFGTINAEDRFEGYAAERTELLKFIRDNAIDNVVFISGDFHGTIVNNLAYQELLPAGAEGSPVVESTPISAFEVVTGPVAFFDSLLGPSTVNLAADSGALSPFLKAVYDGLPVAPDTDSAVNDKDDFLKSLIDTQLEALDYDPVGLNKNLGGAEGLIDAELREGDYLACHTFGWAEFEIDPGTQDLLVTVYGVDAHSEADLLADPNGVVSRTPRVVSQFIVHPKSTKVGDLDRDDDVDFRDFAIFASFWLAESGQPGWNAAVDIAYPQDGVVDTLDLGVFLQNWLLGLE
ncbi:MAG: alkaline phosphatase D family protein [Phycisphaerales bacterium]|jgi:3-phytase/alkaline phosphatase D